MVVAFNRGAVLVLLDYRVVGGIPDPGQHRPDVNHIALGTFDGQQETIAIGFDGERGLIGLDVDNRIPTLYSRSHLNQHLRKLHTVVVIIATRSLTWSRH